ncbi:MAG: glycosyltransferase [Candidatus Firestonebacteria bacterium]
MNIALPGDDYLPSVDGAVTSIMSYTKEFRKMGHKVYIVAPKYPKYVDNEPDIIRCWSMSAPFPPKYRLPVVWFMKQDWKKLNLDIIHSQSPFPLGWNGITVARKLGIPIVNTYHTLYPTYINTYMNIKWLRKPLSAITKKYSAYILNKCDLVISPSPQMAKDLVEYGVKVPIEIMPTGIDLDKFKGYNGDDFRKKYNIGKDEKMLLCMCRLGREKNINFLIDALPLILKEIPNARLVISGEGVAKPELEEQAKKLGVYNKIVFLGFLNHQDWVNAYAAEDLFVFASLTETQGLVLLEAMYFNKPVVCVGEMGVIDMMNGFEKQTGGYLTKNDLNDFAEKVVRLLHDKNLYDAKAKEARERALEMSSENMAKKMLGIYERLIKESKN